MSEIYRQLIPPQLYQNHFSDIKFKTSFGNCVRLALQFRKWKQVQDSSYTLQWSQKERVNDAFDQGINGNQRINHFRLYTQLCRKDLLIKNIRKYKKQLAKSGELKESQWNFYPATFFLPSQFIMFSEQFKKNGGLYIMKPTSRCQGVGIFLVNKLSQVLPYKNKVLVPNNQQNQPIPVNKPPVPVQNSGKKQQKQKQRQSSESQSDNQQQILKQQQNQNNELPPNQSYIIQKYINNPLLFGMKKFDLRIYVLCTNYNQLTVWLYRSGFARFTHQPYNDQQIDNLNSHLTNVAIQKQSQNYDQVRGGKWLLNNFKHYLTSRYGIEQTDKCFFEIQNVIIKSLRAVQKSIVPSKSSFELYGYDLMIDNTLKPWLIEVNGGPSMTANTQFDCKLKCGLIDDALSIVNLQGILQGDQHTVGGFDLIVHQDINVNQHEKYTWKTFLGGKNQRLKVIRRITHKFLMNKLNKNKKYQENIENKIQKIQNHTQSKAKKQNQKNDSNTGLYANNKKQQKKIQKIQKVQKNDTPNIANGNNSTKQPQKLLPKFYYARKQAQINQNARQQLIEQLKALMNNAEKDNDFIPLGFIKQ